MKITKRVLSLIMVLVTLISVVSISAEALNVVVYDDEKYGYMVPVNNKGTKVVSTVKLYGSYDYLNLYINARYRFPTYFFYEIYSDKKLTKCVESDFITTDEKGTYNISPKIKLKGKYKTKTYYVVTYAAKYYESNDELAVDANSLCQFEMIVDRSPSYDEKMVALKSVSNTVNGPKITWSKISGTSEYYIYRRGITSTKFKKVGSVSGKNSSFVDTSVKKKDGNYIYTVKGIGKNGDASRYHFSGLTCLYAESPKINSVKLIEDNVIKIEWKKTDSDAIYHIYRKEIGGDWKKLDTDCHDNYYSDIIDENGKEYMYRVRSVIKNDYGKATSAYYVGEKKTVKFLSAPVMNDLEITESGIGLSWNSVEGAKGYSVLRKHLDSDEDWTVLENVSAETTAYVDTTASLTDGAYLYSVRSEGDGFSGSYSSGKEYFTLAQPEFNISVDNKGVHISWDKIPYATSYRILEQKDDGTWKIKKKTKKTSYEFKPSSYYGKKITVCAVRSGVESSYKTDVEEIRYFPQITPTFKEFDTYTKIEWKSTYADNYRVYRKLKDAPDTDYELLYEKQSLFFINESPENDIAYTYQIRGVYGDVEQYNNFVSKNHTRFSPETCIENFKVTKKTEVLNYSYKSSDIVTEYYCFDVDKTDSFKKATANIYYLGMNSEEYNGWYRLGNVYEVDVEEDVFNVINPLRFSCVVSNSKGSTPIGAEPVYVNEETCDAPVVTLTPTRKGFKMTWKAVNDAVEYDVNVDFPEKTDYKETIEADGSKTYSVSFTDIDYGRRIEIRISAVHKNGNITTRCIESYKVAKAPKLLTAAVESDGIEIVWDGGDNSYAILRKAEGESKWTVISKKKYDGRWCIMIDGVEYSGLSYKDTTAKKGVKYTYTVRRYDPQTKEYVSYYNTKGISAQK